MDPVLTDLLTLLKLQKLGEDTYRGASKDIGTPQVFGGQVLAQALADGTVSEDMAVLVTDTARGTLALLTDQMWYHHLAQGREGGEPWMVSF